MIQISNKYQANIKPISNKYQQIHMIQILNKYQIDIKPISNKYQIDIKGKQTSGQLKSQSRLEDSSGSRHRCLTRFAPKIQFTPASLFELQQACVCTSQDGMLLHCTMAQAMI